MEKEDLQRPSHEDLFIPKRHQLEGCTNPIHQAHGVPNEYYIRPECFEMEGDHLIKDGLLSDLSKIYLSPAPLYL